MKKILVIILALIFVVSVVSAINQETCYFKLIGDSHMNERAMLNDNGVKTPGQFYEFCNNRKEKGEVGLT